jgi:hypothetical protein
MLKELEGYSWAKAFEYAGVEEYGEDGPWSRDGTPNVSAVLTEENTPVDHFVREDVVEIYGIEEGENDGPTWIVYGRLSDGRYFNLAAGCDYTGWD